MTRLNKFLNEAGAGTAVTEMIETASCIGFVLGPSIIKLIDTKPEEAFKKIQSVNGKGSYDWSPQGVSLLKSVKEESDDYFRILALVKGAAIFMRDVGSKIVGKNVHFLQNTMNKKGYYKLETERFGDQAGHKANTSDVIIMNVPKETFYEAFKKGDIKAEDGYYTIDKKIKVIQISLKQNAQGGAQLGKIKNMLRGMGFLQEEMMDEGLWTKMASMFSGLWNKLKQTIDMIWSKITAKYMDIFTKDKISKSDMDEFKSIIEYNDLTEAKKKKDYSALVQQTIKNKTKLINDINAKIKRIEAMSKDDSITVKSYGSLSPATEIALNDSSTAFILMANFLTVKTVERMLEDTKDLSKNVRKIIGDMFFGGTKLPLWVVYGYDEATPKPYKLLGTFDAYVKDVPKKKGIEIVGVSIKPQATYYTINLAMIEGINEEQKTYVMVRTGTKSSSEPSFNMEGRNKKSIPLDESVEKLL